MLGNGLGESSGDCGLLVRISVAELKGFLGVALLLFCSSTASDRSSPEVAEAEADFAVEYE